MRQFNGSEIADNYVENLVYRDKQVEENSVILTVDRLEMLNGKPFLDFGGGEYQKASRRKMEPVKRDEDDDYGWWNPGPGRYIAVLNESIVLEEGVFGIVQPWRRLYMNGVSHQTVVVNKGEDEISLLLDVGEQGVEIKENARISVLKVFKSF